MPTKFKLLKVSGVKEEWESVHKLRALEINGRCLVNKFIESKLKCDIREYKRIFKIFKMVAAFKRVITINHVKSYREDSKIKEIIAKDGHSRISFFYFPNSNEDVICVLPFWKGNLRQDDPKQNTFFNSSIVIMNSYLEASLT